MIRLFLLLLIAFQSVAVASETDRIDPADLTYLGAFLVPSGFENTGFRITINPNGNSGNGSLYIGDGRDGYGGYIAETSIPTAVHGVLGSLNRATVLQAKNTAVDSILVSGANGKTQGQMAYSVSRGKLYIPSYDYYNTGNSDFNSLSWIDTDSTGGAGIWHISGTGMVNKVGAYAFLTPQSWADTHTGGKSLIVGYHRGFANQSSNGPTMFATAPWAVANPPADGAEIPSSELLRYPSIDTVEGGTDTAPITNFATDYSMSHHARGGTWVDFGGKRAVVFVGVAGTNSNYCYGAGCSAAICAPRQGPNNPPYSPRMWWYDIDDFESTASGSITSDIPAPYSETEPTDAYNGQCGTSSDMPEFYQSVAFDDTTGKLYVAEVVYTGTSDETVVHVYQLDSTPALPTCIDGIQNGDETGIDCGGSCTSCEPVPVNYSTGSYPLIQ